jgi:hypothetical protein
VLLILLAAATAAVAQPPRGRPTKPPATPARPAGKKPEASAAADFKPAELAKLAVLVSAGRPGRLGSTDPQRLVEDAFLECLLAKGYTLAARSDVDAVLREKKFQESGATEELAASVGKVLNVPAVLLVRVTDLSSDTRQRGVVTTRASVGARLVSVESGAILWTGNHTDGGPTVGRSAAGAVLLGTASALAEAFPDKPKAARPRPIDPKAVPKLAVLTVGGSPPRRGPARVAPQSDRDRRVEDVFVQVRIQKGSKLVSRSDLQAVLKEQAFQKSGLTEDNAVAAGKLLKVPAVLLVGVNESASEALPAARGGRPGALARAAVGARLVDVASGEVRWAHAEYQTRAVAGKGDAADLLAEVAKDVAGFLPPVPDSPRGLLERATRLESLLQVSAARRAYRELTDRHAKTAEGKRAATRLKALGD